MKTLDMQFIRYLNLFERASGVRTSNCFEYNSVIIFAVPVALVSRAIGENGNNAKNLREVIGKNIKIIAIPGDIEKFILDRARRPSFLYSSVYLKNLFENWLRKAPRG